MGFGKKRERERERELVDISFVFFSLPFPSTQTAWWVAYEVVSQEKRRNRLSVLQKFIATAKVSM